ncbi:MAG: hypothetical protein AAF804_12275 [Bacteroidota bacterium]
MTCLSAQGQELGYFEGRLKYQIKIEGEDAPFILDNKPNQTMEIMVGEGNYIVQLTGGEYPKTLIFIADSNYEYTLDMESQRAFRLSPHFDLNRETHEEEPEAIATGRTGKIGEYFCSEYKITREDLILYYYVSDDYRIDRNAFPEIPRSKAMFLVKGLEGRIPIRTIKRTPTLTVTTNLSNLSNEDYVKENFTIPEGFRVKWRDYRY